MLSLKNIEQERLKSVRSYRLIHDSAKQDFNKLARIAAILCDVPVVLISLMEECEQLFLSHYGIDLDAVPREETFCEVLLQSSTEPLIVTDALLDNRFVNNKYVTGYPHIRFYAGFPLINDENHVLGTLCVVDHKPRNLSNEQVEGLHCLVNQILQIFELQKKSNDLKISRKLFKEKSERFENIIEASNIGTWEWNLETGHVYYNEKTAAILGYSLDELQPATKDTFLSRMHENDRINCEKQLSDYFDGTLNYFTCEYRIRHKNGNWVWILDRGKAVAWDEKGQPLLMFGTHTDITLRKVASMRLINSNKRLKIAQKIAKLGYYEINTRKNTAFLSDQIYEIWEVDNPDEKFDIDDITARIHPEDVIMVKNKIFKEVIDVNTTFEFRIVINKHKIKWIRGSKMLSTNDTNRIEGTFQDITSYKKLEVSLVESERRYSNLFQMMPIPSWVYDLNTLKIIEVNKAALKDYGYSREEFLNLTLKDLRPVEEINKLMEVIAHTKNNVKSYKIGGYLHKRKNGSIFNVEVHSNRLYRDNALYRVVMAVNISETQKYIEEIENQNSTLQEIARIQSHVVRAPLAKIMGIVELVNANVNLTADENRIFLNEILNSATEFDQIVRSIADNIAQLKNN